MSPFAVPGADQPELQPVYAGPTPADPFGGRVFDIFDVMDQAERAAELRPVPRATSAVEIVTMTAPEFQEPQQAEPEKVGLEHGKPEQGEPTSEHPPTPQPELVLTSAEPVSEATEVPPVQPTTAQSAAALPSPEVPPIPPPEPVAPKPRASRARAVAAPPPEADPSPAMPPQPEIVNTVAPEPAGEAILDKAHAEPDTHPTLANGSAEEIMVPEPPPPEPLVKPILIGANGEQPAEKKRGWWRR